ncbi:MAG: GNAT family N-acetyltransferase, partial [Chloroflexi bacterium]|nr:GNAT family N-acetyltransferase [Chloroflexota bacterium]
MTITSTALKIIARPFQGEQDYWRVRDLLIETFPITPVDFNWEIRRWEGRRFHDEAPFTADWNKPIRLWETEDGKLVGAAHHEGEGNAYVQIHPDYRHLIEAEMLRWAEQNLTTPSEDGAKRQVDFFVYEYDVPRQRLLTEQGFEKTPDSGVMRLMRMGSKPLPEPVIANGYIMRTLRLGDHGDCQRIADLVNAAFNRTFHTGADYYNFMMHAPSYRADLHLVAEAPDGSFAAHVGITLETTNNYAVFEPVCTHPDHRRNGLAQSLMFEGLHRLKALNADKVMVGTGDAVAANALYETIGFT